MLNEQTDQMDSYIQCFERYARPSQWREDDWAALLTGSALQAYSRLSEDDALNYPELKTNLLKRYNLTGEGYRRKFRKVNRIMMKP